MRTLSSGGYRHGGWFGLRMSSENVLARVWSQDQPLDRARREA